MKPTAKNLFLLGFIALMLVTIPLTLFFVKKQQDLQSKASPSSNLSLVTNKDTLNIADTTSVDVMLDPGQNIPSFVKIALNYDPEKIEIVSITPDAQNAPTVLAAPVIASNSATVELGLSKILTGYDPTSTTNNPLKVATIEVKGKAATGAEPTKITFDFPGETQVYSISAEDGPNENVLVNATPLALTVVDGPISSITPSLSPSPSASPSPTLVPRQGTPTPTPIANTPPVCTNLAASTASGSAPLVTSFTVSGNDPDGTISKATFNFGDGEVVDVTQGLSTKTITVQQSHTYTTGNTFNASVVLTDNGGATSQSCTTTLSVTASSGGANETAPTPTDLPAPTAVPTLPPTGSITTVLGIGGAIILTILGGLIIFAL